VVYRLVPFQMIRSDLQGHSSALALFKWCDILHRCAAPDNITTNKVVWSFCDSWATSNSFIFWLSYCFDDI